MAERDVCSLCGKPLGRVPLSAHLRRVHPAAYKRSRDLEQHAQDRLTVRAEFGE